MGEWMSNIGEALESVLDSLTSLPADEPTVFGPLLVAAGALSLAWLLFRQRNAPGRSAPGDHDARIRSLIKQGGFEAAADLCADHGDHETALELYRRSSNKAKVARCLVDLRRPGEAADTYLQLGRHAEAAHYYQAASRWCDAADSLIVLDSEREAAELYERGGELQRAAELMKRLDDHENAARLFARAGLGVEAAECLLAARQRTPKILSLAAGQFAEGGDRQRAADCYLQAGQLRRAGELYEEIEAFGRAAQCFAREQIWDRAGSCYARAGALEDARACYERAGDRVQAAQLAHDLGESFQAGRAFYELGSYERALEVLQGVQQGDPEARDSRRLIARIFIEKGLHERAREVLDDLRDAGDLSKEELEELLMLATALERTGDGMGALRALEQIHAIDDTYADVAERLERLQERAWGGSLTPQDSERYELRDEIGRGGMGIVHLAWDLELERPVAIKFLPAELASAQASVKMFRQEARAAAAMNHPNIVHVYDVAIVSGQACIVMEYVQGRTVREIMRGRGQRERSPLPARRVAEIGRDICEALGYAHTQNVIHRDVKPGNMLIATDGRVKLMDFGISKVLETGGEGLTQAKGTPQYMPPEQILGREIDGRTDLYALAISMFEMASGRRPFSGENIVDQQLHVPVPDPRELREDLPEDLVQIILRACEKQPDDRYSSAREMAEALTAFLDEFEDTITR